MEALTQALTTGINSIATECLEAVGTVVPAALPIAGGIIVVTLGVKLFKRMAS